MIEGRASLNGSNGKVDSAARRTALRKHCYLRFSGVAATSVMTIFASSARMQRDALKEKKLPSPRFLP